jgi:Peptidase family M23
MLRIAVLLLALLATPAMSQSSGMGGGPIQAVATDHNTEIDAIHRATVAQARRLGLDRGLPRALPRPILGFPLRLRPNAKAPHGHAISNFVDLDSSAAIKEFTCGSRSYDGHKGIDYFLWPFGWVMMDRREMEIVAAAPGSIASKHDGEFDRQCSANSQTANSVIVLQDDGVYALYWHMKKRSVTNKAVGSRVAQGEYLGLVASSGSSTGPHLHFELRTKGGTTIDPYAGRCGDRRTSWKHQHEDAHTAIVRVAAHKAVPNPGNSECGQNFPTNYADKFRRGDRVWIAAYVRDQRSDTPVRFKIFNPDGAQVLDIASGTPPASTIYSAAYWYVWLDLPTRGSVGQWTARVTLDGQTVDRPFILGRLPNPTKLASVVRPLTATASRSDPAKFRVVVRNTGTTEAVGCTLAPDYPLAALSTYVVRSTRAKDAAFNIAAGGREILTLTIRPKRRYRARSIEVPIRVFCTNAAAPRAKSNANIVTLSF